MKKFLLIPIALLASSSLAAPVISAQSIIVNPKKPTLQVQVSLDKPSSGSNIAQYRIGDSIRISAKVNRDAYVYLFNVNAAGKVHQILPNQIGGNNYVRAGNTVSFPATTDQFTFDIAGPVGLNKVLALASSTKLDLSSLSKFQSSQAQFATVKPKGQERLAQALSIVVNPVPQTSWVTSTALFTVVPKVPVRKGHLFVGTNAPNSTVILNGRNLGNANRTFLNIAPGKYPIRVRAKGFNDYRTTVEIKPNVTTNVNVEFNVRPSSIRPTRPSPARPAPVAAKSYNLTVSSRVEGARVFVDGTEVGRISRGLLNTRVAAGAHEVVIIAEGYKTYLNNVTINRNVTIKINPSK